MKSIKKLAITLFISYAIVLIVNLTANYQYYASGNNWRFSVFFCLTVTTLGWLGYILLYQAVFKKYLNWKKNPNANLLLSVLLSGAYGVGLMVLVMKCMVWFLHFTEHTLDEYTNNSIYAALFAMLIGLIVNGQEFLKQLKKSADDNEIMKQEMLRSQYGLLKSQVNPHFFFNALTTLTSLIQEAPEVASLFVQHLAKVFRYSLQNMEGQTVALETELKIVQSFLFINKERFNEKLMVDVHVDSGAMQQHIIVHSLITLVENALKHNEISNASPLHINIFNEGNMCVTVTNTLQPRKLTEKSLGIGLVNIVERYALITEKSVTIDKGYGLFTVKLPLLNT
jgi:two-component system LytT family sensor kinase